MAETQDEAEEGSCLLPALDQLPPHFLAFLKENQVPYDAYNLPVIYRFLRYEQNVIDAMGTQKS